MLILRFSSAARFVAATFIVYFTNTSFPEREFLFKHNFLSLLLFLAVREAESFVSEYEDRQGASPLCPSVIREVSVRQKCT